MKKLLPLITLLCFNLFSFFCHAQGSSAARDSMLLRLNASLKAGLGLSDAKAARLLVLQRAQVLSMDSIRSKGNLTARERGESRKAINKAYKKELKALFNQEQMERYEALEEAQQAALKSRIKERREKEKKKQNPAQK